MRVEAPTLIIDGDCARCVRWGMRIRKLTNYRVDVAAYQDVAFLFRNIPRSRFEEAVHLIEPDGTVSWGAAAAFRAVSYAPGARWAWPLYRRVPGMARLSERAYKAVSKRRK